MTGSATGKNIDLYMDNMLQFEESRKRMSKASTVRALETFTILRLATFVIIILELAIPPGAKSLSARLSHTKCKVHVKAGILQ